MSKTFDTKSAAERWARGVERDIDEGRAKGKGATGTVGDLLDRYQVEMQALRPIGRSKQATLGMLRKRLGHVRLRDLDSSVVVRFARERRAGGAGPATVTMDLAYLGTVLRTARALWHLSVSDDAVRDARQALRMVGMAGKSESRDRRPTRTETEALCAYWRGNKRQKMPLAELWEFALASAMRLGEITSILWADLDEASSTIVIRDRKDPRKKAGNDERVPLLFGALDIILRQPRTDERIFPYHGDTVSTEFPRACHKLGIVDLRWHDSRHEAVTRLFERGLSIEQVSMVSGHKDWKNLRRYTQLRPEDLVTLSLSRSLPASEA